MEAFPRRPTEVLDIAVKKAIDASKNVRRLLRRPPVRDRIKKEIRAAAAKPTFQ